MITPRKLLERLNKFGSRQVRAVWRQSAPASWSAAALCRFRTAGTRDDSETLRGSLRLTKRRRAAALQDLAELPTRLSKLGHSFCESAIVAAVALLAASALFAVGAEPGDVVREPAPSLTRPTSTEKSPDADGFIQRWLILEPIATNAPLTDRAVQAAVKTDYFPNQLSVIPHDGDKVTVNGTELTWRAVDTKGYNVNLYHFAYALDRPTSFVLFWAVTIVNCPQEISGVRLAIGSNAASVWWVNGTEVIGIYGDRQTVIDDGVSKRLTLKKGPNIVRCAIINGGGATDFCARFLDAQDNPLKNFTLTIYDAKQP